MGTKDNQFLDEESNCLVAGQPDEPVDLSADQAIIWVARLRADNVSTSDHREFSTWITASQRNKDSFDEVVDLWQDLAVVSHLPIADMQIFDSQEDPTRQLTGWSLWNWSTSGSRTWRLYAPAFAALFLAVLVSWYARLSPTEYSTAIGEQKTVTLRDGSMLFLNTNTSVVVKLRDDLRSITLNYGEAFFDVAHDPQRPFEVEACRVTTRALGTSFNVRCEDDSVAQITVSEGVVRVSTSAERVELAKGQQISYAQTSGLSSQIAINAEDITAWKRQLLIYDGVALGDIVNDMNRYSDQKIIVSDPVLRNLKVVLRTTMKDRITNLRSLEKAFPSLKVIRTSSQTLELVPTDRP